MLGLLPLLHLSIIFNFNFLHSKNFKFLHCLGLIDMLSANKNGDIFSCILLRKKLCLFIGGEAKH